MKRLTFACVALALVSISCGSSAPSTTAATSVTAVKPTFTATLLPSNEVPPVSNGEKVGSGSVTIVFNTTTDAAGNVTSATANFSVSLFGFPAGTAINVAHIHQGASTCVCPVVVSTTLAASDQLSTNTAGALNFAKNNIPISDPAVAQAIMNNPSGYYFNVHSTLNPGGVARGVLARTQ
ncbi:MAG TPA: CHRD domain-containing protein [Vicinamibacterales bacterium]|nr:CHRD domain-containing protein [Vicinamibacterales bacterium]